MKIIDVTNVKKNIKFLLKLLDVSIYLPRFNLLMKIKTFGWAFLILLILTNIWAKFTEIYWVENTTYILYFLAAVLLVQDKYKKFKRPMYLFLGFTVLSYLTRSFAGEGYSYEISLVFLTTANIILIRAAAGHIEFKNASHLMMLYFIIIVGINACLLGYHVWGIKDYIKDTAVLSVYILYYINLLILGIVALIYYLNSYSRKSMYFISLALGIIFADILRDMGVFFPEDISVEVAESIIRLACAVFAVLFFVTTEKQLRLLNMI